MKDQHHNEFKKALDQLPSYKADEHIWDSIEKELQEEQEISSLPHALRRLPVYQAPAFVWERISRKLDRRKSFTYVKWAASVLILCTAGIIAWTVWGNEQANLPVQQPAEKAFTFDAPLTPDEIAEFQTQLEVEESNLQTCIESRHHDSASFSDIAKELDKLHRLRDSIHFVLGTETSHAKLKLLENKRQAQFQMLQERYCP